MAAPVGFIAEMIPCQKGQDKVAADAATIPIRRAPKMHTQYADSIVPSKKGESKLGGPDDVI